MKGWNWGDAKFEGSLLSFMVDSKPAFEIPLEEVSQAIPGKNEITLEFHQNDETPVSLVEMRFHIPNVEGSEDPVKVWGGMGTRFSKESRQGYQALRGKGDLRHCEGKGSETRPENKYCLSDLLNPYMSQHYFMHMAVILPLINAEVTFTIKF